MIFDKINNWKYYFKNPIFLEIFEKLSSIDLNSPNGEYYRNEDYYFKVMNYVTKTDADIIESHRNEVDIQILLSGKEGINIYDKDNVEILKPYAEETDCQFYINPKSPNSELILKPDYMAVFFPQDIHNPQIAVNKKPIEIKKIIIKVNEKLFAQ